MPRTLPSALTAAMDSGNYEPYIQCVYGEDHDDAVTEIPLRFRIRGLTATVTIPKGSNDAADYATFRLERGAIINGTVYSISTIYYYSQRVIFDGKFVTLHGHLFPPNIYATTGTSANYQDLIQELMEGWGNGEASYEGTAAWKSYYFYPIGTAATWDDIKTLFPLLQQKYLVHATENGWTPGTANSNDVFFFVASESRTEDYTISDPLFTSSNEFVSKRLIWKDENSATHAQGSAALSQHNLGFLEYGATAPGNSIPSPTGASFSSKLPVHLKYRTGDWVTINPDDNGMHEWSGRIDVEEVFDPESTPSWHNIIRPLQFFSTAIGAKTNDDILPEGRSFNQAPDPGHETGSIGPLTPIFTPPFAGHLSSFDNTVQAAFETLDSHTHPYTDIPGTPAIREKLSAARTYYVRTDGNDANTGLVNAVGGAFLTIQKAVDTIAALDINGQMVTVQVANGTYTGAVVLKNVTGYATAGNLLILGNTATPTNVVINTTGTAFTASYISTIWDIAGFKITPTTGNAIFALASTIRFSSINFAATSTGYVHLYADFGGKLVAVGNYDVSGGAYYHMCATRQSFIIAAYLATVFSNNPAFTTFAYADTLSNIATYSMTYTNAATVTGKRYEANTNAVILAAGGTLPGTVGGTTSTGGQYS